MADATSSLRAAVERLQNSQKDENSVEACKDGLVHLRRLVACAASEARKAELELQQADVAFNATWTSLQSVELERKFVLEEIGELEMKERQMRETWISEGVFGDVSLLDVEGSNFDTELERRAAGELKGREELQVKLRELQARKQALQAKKAQEAKGLHSLETELDVLLKSMEGNKCDVRETDTPARISWAMEMLPLPLRLLYNQFSACKRALDLNIELIIRDKEDRKSEDAFALNPYGLKGDLVVILKIFEMKSPKVLLAMEFREKSGLVYVYSPLGQVLLSSLFKGDTGFKMPSRVVPGLAPGPLELTPENRDKPGFPYIWAQLLGGVDFLPRHDVSTDDEAVVCQVDKGIELYRREQRVPQFLQRIRQHSLDLTDFKRGISALSAEGGTKQCMDPLTRAKMREFSLIKTSRRGSESGSKRRRGEDSSIISGTAREKPIAAGQHYVMYRAVLDCEGIELRARVCFPMTRPRRPLFFIESISAASATRRTVPSNIESARKWMGAQLSSTDYEGADPVAHLTKLVETFGAWVATLMGSVRPAPVLMGRARAVYVPSSTRG